MKNVVFSAGVILMVLGSVPTIALASSHKDTGKGPVKDTQYCIRDFQTGRLLCLLVPDPELDEA
jgi:hypothetical protein